MDIRIINTKHRIQTGLITMIGEKPLYQVKDKDIISKAEVSAASYYKYYRDKSVVIKDLETELIQDYRTALYADSKGWFDLKYAPNKKEISKRIDNDLSNLFNFVSAKKEFIIALTSPNGDPVLKSKMLDLTAQVIKRLLIHYFQIYGQASRLDTKKFEVDILSKIYAHAFLCPILFWINHTDKMSLTDGKNLIKNTILRSPYEISTHDLDNRK